MTRRRTRLTGWDIAIYVMGWGVLVFVIVVILWPVVAGGEPGKRSACFSNLKQTSLGTMMYSTDFDDRLPPARTWADAQMPYMRNSQTYRCPELPISAGRVGHAFRRNLGLVDTKTIRDLVSTVMLFDSRDLSWNANGGLNLIPPAGRHSNGTNSFAFVDGHVRALTTPALFDYVRATENDRDHAGSP